eukprot:3723903-Prymnesium_polylepis.2
MTVLPEGMKAVSPSTGSTPPGQVIGLLQRLTYSNCRTPATFSAAKPELATCTEALPRYALPPPACAPLEQRTTWPSSRGESESTAQGTSASRTLMPAATVPSARPLIVRLTSVPPSTEPCTGPVVAAVEASAASIICSVGVAAVLYCSAPMSVPLTLSLQPMTARECAEISCEADAAPPPRLSQPVAVEQAIAADRNSLRRRVATASANVREIERSWPSVAFGTLAAARHPDGLSYSTSAAAALVVSVTPSIRCKMARSTEIAISPSCIGLR